MDILPDEAPAPRLCHLIKWPDFDGYGFNLHAERANPGQFIGKIDDDSPAQMAGLREGDRIVEVNGVNISNENHRQVVERIKSDPKETKLLVVEPETDAWYREQDIVIKSSQLNVVYMKTPVPRPEPDSPRAKFHQSSPGEDQSQAKSEARSESSLETSDFNDDSIEQQQQRVSASAQLSPQPIVVEAPPMSPDSGRGPDDEDSAHLASGGVLTVEAEINRQSPQIVKQMLDSEDDDSANEAAAAANARDEEKEKPIGVKSAATENGDQREATIEPDSLNSNDAKQQQQQDETKQDEEEEEGQKTRSKLEQTITSGNESSAMRTADAVASTKQMDETKAPADDSKFRSGSAGADSGQSSSADTSSSRASSSSRSDSIADSLEEQPRAAASESRENIKNYLASDGTGHDDDDSRMKNNNNDVSGLATPNPQDVSGEHAATKQPLRSALVNNSSNNSNNNNNAMVNNLNEQPQAKAYDTGLETQQKNANNTSSNNFNGLNLNMTASEMREILASRKKFDPKKAQMNIRQKYEIIQQM